jgi:hypothetical protein
MRESQSQEFQFSEEVRHLRASLVAQFGQAPALGSWEPFLGTLKAVDDLAQFEGQIELSLRAQSLRELVGERLSGCSAPSPRVLQLFDDLVFHLSHLHWHWQALGKEKTEASGFFAWPAGAGSGTVDAVREVAQSG